MKFTSTLGEKKRVAIVLMGSPGSGKTTLARGLAEHRPLSIIEVGSLLKREVQLETTVGKTIQSFTTTGKLVPLEFVEKIVSKAVGKTKEDLVLFDGIPRSTTQIAPFLKLLADHDLELGAVIVLTLDLQTALDRLTGRLVCQKCGALYNVSVASNESPESCEQCGGKLVQRVDDRIEIVQARFRRFARETVPVIDFFKKKFSDLTWEQSATPPIKERIDRVWLRLQEYISRNGQGKFYENNTVDRPSYEGRRLQKAIERWENEGGQVLPKTSEGATSSHARGKAAPERNKSRAPNKLKMTKASL